jgi:hypothetical protein
MDRYVPAERSFGCGLYFDGRFRSNHCRGPFQVKYGANLNIGESNINITNTGANAAALPGPGYGTQSGNICVNVYAFDLGSEKLDRAGRIRGSRLASLALAGQYRYPEPRGGTTCISRKGYEKP